MEQTGKFSNGRAALGLLALVILAAAQLGAQLLASLPLMVGAPVWLGNVLAGVLYAALGVAGLLLLCGKGLRVTPEECRLAPVRLRPVWAASAVLMPALAAGALLRARHLLCTGGETAVLDRLADRAAELYRPHKDHITQDARLRSLGGQIQKMRAAEESMPARTAGQQAELADGWLHTAAAAMAADVSCMLKMSGRENTQAEEEEVRMGFC